MVTSGLPGYDMGKRNRNSRLVALMLGFEDFIFKRYQGVIWIRPDVMKRRLRVVVDQLAT